MEPLIFQKTEPLFTLQKLDLLALIPSPISLPMVTALKPPQRPLQLLLTTFSQKLEASTSSLKSEKAIKRYSERRQQTLAVIPLPIFGN